MESCVPDDVESEEEEATDFDYDPAGNRAHKHRPYPQKRKHQHKGGLKLNTGGGGGDAGGGPGPAKDPACKRRSNKGRAPANGIGSNMDAHIDIDEEHNQLSGLSSGPLPERQVLSTLSKHILQKIASTCSSISSDDNSANTSAILWVFHTLTGSGESNFSQNFDFADSSLDALADRVERADDLEACASFIQLLNAIHFRLKVER